METINIALAADNNYAQHVAVVMESILENTDEANKVRFFLLSDAITAEKITGLQQTISGKNAELVICDLSAYKGFEKLYTSGHISKAAYFRLDMANILPEDVNKVIYLDVDLLVLQEIGRAHV